MKEKDFDDIGKRLHDMEADPPKDGWKKIVSAVQGPGHPGKWVWLRKNGWKPLILLIPVLTYLLLNKGKHDDTLHLASSTNTQAIVEHGQQKKTDSLNTPESTETKLNPPAAEKTNEKKTETQDHLKPLRAAHQYDDKRSNKRKPLDRAAVVADHAGNTALKEHATSVDQQPGSDSIRQQEITTVIGSLRTDSAMENNTLKNETRTTVDKQDTAVVLTEKSFSVAAAESTEKIVSTDSTQLKDSAKEKEKNKKPGTWRLTAAFAPQFVSNTIKPVTNDEVLVTTVSQGSSMEQMGYNFAVGAGKAITSHFYVDGQLTYSFIQQDLQYSYTNGAVDTLLTVEQPDMSYLVTPVYAVENREVSGKYSYAGLRLGTTYYFLATERSRFNLMANVGAHYLLAADVKEKIGDDWVKLSNEGVNKMNYSFSIGAGYNRTLGKGWELMINPMLTWYLKEVKNQSVPFSLREEAWGLNVMLSKTLGR